MAALYATHTSTTTTTFPQNLKRTSQETDRRHLLSDSLPPSAAPSILSYADSTLDGDRTPRAHSPAPSTQTQTTQTPQTYRGFPSEAHYLAALREWAEDHQYEKKPDVGFAFYGEKTMQDYASQPRVELGLRRKWRERKGRKNSVAQGGQREERRNTVA